MPKLKLAKRETFKKKKWYVYFLIDPRDSSIFYIGKGSGKRMYHHQKKLSTDCNQVKIKKIIEIEKSGGEVIHKVFKRFYKESEAYKLERELIQKHKKTVTNIANGIVTGKEQTIAWCDNFISRLKTKNAWLSQIDARSEIAQIMFNIFGSPAAAYDSIVNGVKDIRETALINNN